ncbi:MAG: protein phosphatase 2C domain-containing protein [Planctomycetes bacterium]|nr:protein phosphatase 2C domain-containing protein [Planctomycetota bacterium]
MIGAKHVRDGKVCQDAILGHRDYSRVVLAVADGHGTSLHGEVGAQCAVEVAVEHLARFATELPPGADLQAVHRFAEHPLRVQLVREWTARVRKHAGDANAPLKPYGTTLIFALATPTFLLVGQLGDGDVLLVTPDQRVLRPVPSDATSFADETASMCQPEAWSSMRVVTRGAPVDEALLIMSTDGYSKSYASDEVFDRIGPDYLTMVRDEGIEAVEGSLKGFLEAVTSGGSGDDIAFGLLHWPARPGCPVAASEQPAVPTPGPIDTPPPDRSEPEAAGASSETAVAPAGEPRGQQGSETVIAATEGSPSVQAGTTASPEAPPAQQQGGG